MSILIHCPTDALVIAIVGTPTGAAVVGNATLVGLLLPLIVDSVHVLVTKLTLKLPAVVTESTYNFKVAFAMSRPIVPVGK